MSKDKLKGLIDYLNTVKEKYTANKTETLLEIANDTYSYIENLEKKLKITEEALLLISHISLVEAVKKWKVITEV